MGTASPMDVDVLMATDLRFPGGSNASVVEEVLAQERAGYRTGLLHIPSPVQRSHTPFAPRIRSLLESGAAELALGQHVRAKVLVVRHPSVLTAPPPWLPEVEADHVVIVANQVPVDPRAHGPYYDVVACHATARRMTGVEPVWAPIGPQVRAALEPFSGEVPIREQDWTNIVDVEAWYKPRHGLLADRPVIGRHTRGHWSKWPAERGALLAAYPDDPRYVVKVLGGTEAPRDILGGLPANWVDLPYNSMSPDQFLHTIDFLVYYHHPDLVEAFGRTILEGVAAGAVAIVDPSFAETFGTACRYAPVDQVRQVIDELSSDPPAYARQSEHGVAQVRERFSYQTHVARISEIIGPADRRDPEPGHWTPSAVDVSDTPHERPARESAGTHRTMVLDPSGPQGASPGVLSTILDASRGDHEADRVVALVAAQEVPVALSAGALVETVPTLVGDLPSTVREQYLVSRIRGLLAVYGGITRIVVVGDTAPLAGAVDLHEFEVWAVERADRVPGTSQPDWQVPGLPSEWRARQVATPPRSPVPARRRLLRSPGAAARRAANVVRQRGPRWVIRIAVGAKKSARSARRRVIGRLAPGGALVPRGSGGPRLAPPPSAVSADRPTALLVATSETLDPDAAIRAVAARAAVSNAFRPVLLAPPEWAERAAEYGLAIETALAESAWDGEYTVRWSDYLRRRIAEVVQVFHPAVAVTLMPDVAEPTRLAAEALDVVEALSAQRAM